MHQCTVGNMQVNSDVLKMSISLHHSMWYMVYDHMYVVYGKLPLQCFHTLAHLELHRYGLHIISFQLIPRDVPCLPQQIIRTPLTLGVKYGLVTQCVVNKHKWL